MKPKVYIDGKEGTTGLQIFERLGSRDDIDLLLIDEEKRKDTAERKKLINSSDIVFLCLPDAAAIEAVELVENNSTRIIDASTAHRTKWTYGFPELSAKFRADIESSMRVANPGCHATGFIVSVYPLIGLGVIDKDYPLSCFSLTGYSGGGKKMIADYESSGKTQDMYSPRIYGLNLQHKHLPEMMHVTGVSAPPVFCPVVDDYYKGMATTVPLHKSQMSRKLTAENIRDMLAEYYEGEKFVKVAKFDNGGLLESNWGAGTNDLEISVCGGEDVIITARFDNLGKGASGAAVQNMNIMLGLDESVGLI